MAKFEVRYTTTTKSCICVDFNDTKLLWRVPQCVFELLQGSKKVTLTLSQLQALFDFLSFARKKHDEFMKVGPWRSEVLNMYGKLGDGEVSAVCQEDEGTRQIYITVTALLGNGSITVNGLEAEKLLSCSGKIQRIRVEQDYQPGQAHPTLLSRRSEDAEEGGAARAQASTSGGATQAAAESTRSSSNASGASSSGRREERRGSAKEERSSSGRSSHSSSRANNLGKNFDHSPH
jgi:hypothetical protein